MSDTVKKYIIPFFIKALVFLNVDLSWLIKTKEQLEFYFDETCAHWCKYGPCCDKTVC